jgi:hypothetical protein
VVTGSIILGSDNHHQMEMQMHVDNCGMSESREVMLVAADQIGLAPLSIARARIIRFHDKMAAMGSLSTQHLDSDWVAFNLFPRSNVDA